MNDKDFLDQLFCSARTTEPYLADDGFSGAVVDKLHALDLTRTKPRLPLWQQLAINVLFALVGGVLACSFLPLDALLAMLPSSLVINPASIAAMALFSAVLSLGGYWLSESRTL